MTAWTLKLHVLEDLHIGTGTGWGDIDALLVRDRHGNPTIPASHIKGVWRDLAQEWHRCDPQSISQSTLERLFGKAGQGQGQLQLTSACLQTPVAPLIWGSTRIDIQTQTARDNSLRQIEYIPAGVHFSLKVWITKAQTGDEAILTTLIGRCRCLGAGRHRGHGQVRWQKETAPPSPAARATKVLPPPKTPARLRLLLRNPDPICLARTGHPGNLIETEAFIRGRALRGAVVAACLTQGMDKEAECLLQTTLSWGDALPLPEKAGPTADTLAKLEVLPIPLSIGTPKPQPPTGSEHTPWWAIQQKSNVLGENGEIDQAMRQIGQRPTEKLKRPKDGEFLHRPDANANTPWQRYSPKRIERMHTQVPNPENGNEQALFTSEEIAENTLFVADIIVSDQQQANTLSTVLNQLKTQGLRIGRGGKHLDIEASHWLPLRHPSSSPIVPDRKELTLLLESDWVQRNGIGNFEDRLSLTAIAAAAGLDNCEGLSELHNTSEGQTLFGFNAVTGLPRQAQLAIKAGSVIRLTGDPNKLAQLRKALQTRPSLGECPEEGLGRYRLDDLPKPVSSTQGRTTPANNTPNESSDEALCREAHDWVHQHFSPPSVLNKPSASQWGDWRNRIQAARTAQELNDTFTKIEEAAQRHGGKNWSSFVQHRAFARLRQRIGTLAAQDLKKAQHLLSDFIRWQRVSAAHDTSRSSAGATNA